MTSLQIASGISFVFGTIVFFLPEKVIKAIIGWRNSILGTGSNITSKSTAFFRISNGLSLYLLGFLFAVAS